MRKIYVIDTSVLIHDPNSFKTFVNSEVIIPVNVLDELDKLKSAPSDVGKNARVCIRLLDAICNTGDIHKGIKIENNIVFKIDTSNLPDTFGPSSYVDNKIISCAFSLKEKNKKKKNGSTVILVSKDINLRIRARVFDIQAQDYEKDKSESTDLYQGNRVICNNEITDILLKKDYVDLCMFDELADLKPNECIYFESKDRPGVLGRRIGDKVYVIKSRKPWGLELRNKEQVFAVDMICDPRLSLVSLIGRAGGGKSLVALASALEMVLEQKKYNKLIIYRPIQSVGNDIGFLPGSMSEKLSPWMEAISDSFEVLFSSSKNGVKWRTTLDRYIADDTIQMDAICYIRGRSLPNALILIDEAQNLSKEEIKTIITRAGVGSKIVLTGDIEQIDAHHLDATNNGLTYVVEKFKDVDLAGHITLTKGERSALASKAAEIL